MKKIYLSLMLLSTALVAEAQTFENDLVAHYPMNGTSTDASQNGIDLTAAGNVTLTPDRYGVQDGAYTLGNGRFTASHSPEFLSMNSGFTISMWVKPTVISGTRTFLTFLQSSDRELVFRMQDGGKTHSHFNSGSLQFCTSDNTVMTAGEWQQIAITWDGTSISHFRNGELLKTCDFSGQNVNIDGGTLIIGALTTSGSESFGGEIDDVRIYSRTFAPTELGGLYAYENLDEGIVLNMPMNSDGTDISEFQNDGDLIGGFGANDRFGASDEAVYLDGVDDYILIPHDTSYKIDYPLTVSTWLYIPDSAQSVRIFTTNNHASSYYGMNIGTGTDGTLNMSVMDGRGFGSQFRRTVFGTTVIVPNEWHHITGVVRGVTDMDLYINGVKEEVTYSGSGLATMAYTVDDEGTVGAWDKSRTDGMVYTSFAIDDLKLWNKALDSLQVSRLQSEGTSNDIGVISSIFTNYDATSQVELFPNPAQNEINLKAKKIMNQLNVVTVQGARVANYSMNTREMSLDIKDLDSGWYMINIEYADGSNSSLKLTKE